MTTTSYAERRSALREYFDATAAEAWTQLTSDAPVSKIRQTVRAGRDRMRALLLSWLPDDLRGARVLDAGCGTGALSMAAAQRGADVVGVDVAGSLLDVARDRLSDARPGSVRFVEGDMLDPAFGRFDFVVAMDSLIHYRADDVVGALSQLAERTDAAMAFTFAPKTVALSAMHAAGSLFPRADRAPRIVPLAQRPLRDALAAAPGLERFKVGRSEQVQSGFYTSHGLELIRR